MQNPAGERRVQNYKASVLSDFEFLQKSTSLDDIFAKSISLNGGVGHLVALSELHCKDRSVVDFLALWRKESAFAFPSRFPVTVEGTQKWLRNQVLDNPTRILFLILDRFGTPVGHLGFANCVNDEMTMEVDNVVRGSKNAIKGLMSIAMLALTDWAAEMFGPEEIYLRVLEDNIHAIKFYQRLGYKVDTLQPLMREVSGDCVNLVPQAEGDGSKPDTHFVKMIQTYPTNVHPSEMILTAGPSISAREISYVNDAIRYGWNQQWSKYLTKFEDSFAEYIGTEYALATSSCTGALHLALLALDIGPGDEVIVPDITWVATGNVVRYVGATPVFADIQPDSWCLDPASFESMITDQTKAVIPVHLYGHPTEMDKIMEVARCHGVKVIEDAAPSIGAEFKGKKTGTFGDLACFSFQGAKLAVTGEGGMLVTSDGDLFDRVKKLADQGRVPGTFWIDITGWKYKMSNIQAAIGLGQLERIEGLVEMKRRIFSWYESYLDGVEQVTINKECAWARSIYWMTSICLNEDAVVSRDDLISALRARNVDTRPIFPAISQYRIWDRPQHPQPVAEHLGRQGINLPSGVCMKQETVEYVSQSIREILHA